MDDFAKKQIFIKTLAETGLELLSASTAELSIRELREEKKTNKMLSEAWDDALEHSKEELLRTARNRAIRGTEKPIYQGGLLVGYVTEYSDALLKFLIERDTSDNKNDNKGGVLLIPYSETNDVDFEEEIKKQQEEYRKCQILE